MLLSSSPLSVESESAKSKFWLTAHVQPYSRHRLMEDCTSEFWTLEDSTSEVWSVEDWPAGKLTCRKIDLREDCTLEVCTLDDWPVENWPAEDWPAEDWPAEDWPAEDWSAGSVKKSAWFLGLLKISLHKIPLTHAQYPYNLKLLALKISAGYKIPSILKSLASQSLLGTKSLRSKSLLGKIPLFKIPSCFLIQNPFAQNPYWIIKINLW